MAQPQEKTNELIEKINVMLKSETVDEVELKRIDRDVTKLMPIDPINAYRLRGFLCDIKNDRAGVIKNFDCALNLSPGNYSLHYDYSVALSNIGLLFDALDYARRAYSLQKTPEILKLLIRLTTKTARFNESMDYLSELKKMKIDTEKENELVDDDIIAFMNRNHVSDDDISLVRSLAEKVVLKNNFVIRSSQTKIYHDNDSECISIKLELNATPKETAELMCDLADEIVLTVPDEFPISKISCGFKSERRSA